MIVYLSIFVPQEHSNEKWSFLFSLSMSTMCLDFCFFGFSSSHGWMWELEHKEDWMPKNWWFELRCYRRLLRIPCTAKEIKPVNPRGNQPYIFIGRTEMLRLKIQYYGWWEESTHWKRPCCWKRLRAGGEGGDRGWDGWMVLLSKWTWVWASSEIVKDREAWHAAVHGITVGHDWVTEKQIVCLEENRRQLPTFYTGNFRNMAASFCCPWDVS